MLRMSLAVLVAVAGTVSVAPMSTALADGMGGSLKDAPPPAEEYVWDGLYVAVGIGAGSFDHDGDVDITKTKTLKKRSKKCSEPNYVGSYECDWGDIEPKYSKTDYWNTPFGDDEWDIFGTMQLGYDRLIHKSLLIGAFVDFDFYPDSSHGFSKEWDREDRKWGKSPSVSGNIDLDHVWSIGGRLGYLVTPRVLLYGVGGYSEAMLDGSIDVDFGYDKTLTLKPDDLKGWFVGGGGEFKVRKNVSLKFEYRYTSLDSDSMSDSDSFTHEWKKYCYEYQLKKDIDAHADLDADIHSVRALLVLKLDEPVHEVAALK